MEDQEIDLSSIKNPNTASFCDVEDSDDRVDYQESLINDDDNYEQEQQERPVEDPLARAKLIMLCQIYVGEFPEKLQGYKDIPWNQLSTDQLNFYKEEMNNLVNVRSNIQSCQNAFNGGAVMLEGFLCSHTSIKAKGIANVLMRNPEVQSDIKAWTLENMDIIKTKPEHRLAMSVAQALYLVHQANTAAESNPTLQNLKADKKYADL